MVVINVVCHGSIEDSGVGSRVTVGVAGVSDGEMATVVSDTEVDEVVVVAVVVVVVVVVGGGGGGSGGRYWTMVVGVAVTTIVAVSVVCWTTGGSVSVTVWVTVMGSWIGPAAIELMGTIGPLAGAGPDVVTEPDPGRLPLPEPRPEPDADVGTGASEVGAPSLPSIGTTLYGDGDRLSKAKNCRPRPLNGKAEERLHCQAAHTARDAATESRILNKLNETKKGSQHGMDTEV
jgi:hypothetical protein